MAREVEPARVPAELLCVAIDPGERAAHLLRHYRQVAAEVLHWREIQDDEVRARVHEQLRGKGVVLRETPAPGTAVDEHVDRCVRARGCKDIEPFDGRGSVGKSPRGTDPRTRRFAVGRIAPGDLRLVGRVDALVVGVVELFLVQVEPNARPFRAGWLLRGLGRRRAGSRSHRAGRADFEEFPSRNAARIPLPAHLLHRRLKPLFTRSSGLRWAVSTDPARFGDAVPLSVVDAEKGQLPQGLVVLHPFGDRRDTQHSPDLGNRIYHGAIEGAVDEIAHERAVDLEKVDGQRLKVGEGAQPRAEVVESETAADALQALEEMYRFREVADGRGL